MLNKFSINYDLKDAQDVQNVFPVSLQRHPTGGETDLPAEQETLGTVLLLAFRSYYDTKRKKIPARLVYVRNRHKRNQYLVLITMDMTLDEEEIICIYCKRWGIEVFFKMCKSYLKLSKGCYSLPYDAMTAHVVIVCSPFI